MRGFFAFLQILTHEAGRLGVLGSGGFSAVGGGGRGGSGSGKKEVSGHEGADSQ